MKLLRWLLSVFRRKPKWDAWPQQIVTDTEADTFMRQNQE